MRNYIPIIIIYIVFYKLEFIPKKGMVLAVEFIPKKRNGLSCHS